MASPSDRRRVTLAEAGAVYRECMRRTVGQLIDSEDDAWPFVLGLVDAAGQRADVVPCAAAAGEATLFALQVTTRSPMGAIALNAGGIIVDSGWLRILGAGDPRFGGGLREWNGLDGNVPLDPPLGNALIVAYDALGGFFALNGGALPGQLGEVHYFAPDTYAFEPLHLTYSGLLEVAFSERLAEFYRDLRWPEWERDVAALGPDQALAVYPPLGFKPGADGLRSRGPISAFALWTVHRSLADQIAALPDGTAVEFRVIDGSEWAVSSEQRNIHDEQSGQD